MRDGNFGLDAELTDIITHGDAPLHDVHRDFRGIQKNNCCGSDMCS